LLMDPSVAEGPDSGASSVPVAAEEHPPRAPEAAETTAEDIAAAPEAADGAQVIATGADPPGSAGGSGGAANKIPKGDLSSRLGGRGLELPGELPSLAHGSLSVAPVRRELGVTAAEKRQLFTPLTEQGKGAVEAEQKRKEASEQELLEGVLIRLKQWVQESFAREDKCQKLKEKGVLKCRIQARWSESLHKQLQQLVARYGGRLMADVAKGKEAAPWVLRNEKWLVGFDLAAFEAFLTFHPEVLDPPDIKVRDFVDAFIKKADINTIKIKDLKDALEAKFGPLRKALLDRVPNLARDAIEQQDIDSKNPKKRKVTTLVVDKGAEKRARIETAADVNWAAAALAPLGLREDNNELVLRCPPAVAMVFLEGLTSFKDHSDFRKTLQNSPIAKVVTAYRHHANRDISRAARELVAAWRFAYKQKVHADKVRKVETPPPRLETSASQPETSAPEPETLALQESQESPEQPQPESPLQVENIPGVTRTEEIL